MYLGKVKTFFLFFVVLFEQKLQNYSSKWVIIMVESKTSPDTNPICFRDFLEAQKAQITIFLPSFFWEDSLVRLPQQGSPSHLRFTVWSLNNLKMDGFGMAISLFGMGLFSWEDFHGPIFMGNFHGKSSNLVIKLNMTP